MFVSLQVNVDKALTWLFSYLDFQFKPLEQKICSSYP